MLCGSALDPQDPATVGPCRIHALLGIGGMGRVGAVLGVFGGGGVVLVPESTLDALSRTAHEAFVEAAEETTGAVVFVVLDAAFTADV